LFAFSTNNLVLFEAGHMSKLASIFSMPLFFAGLFLATKKKYLLGGVIFSVGLAINIYNNHFQMTYLLALITGILMIFLFFDSLIKKNTGHFLKMTAIFILGAALAVATSSSKLWTTWEYSKDTMRGKPILEIPQDQEAVSSSETDGLEWNYAMQWSNGWADLLSSFIPGATGGGSSEPVSPDSEFAIKYRQITGGRSTANLQAPLYWGDLPFTSGPIYFGAIVFFLFLFGALIVKGSMKWWLVAGVLLTMMFSLGKNLEWFNHFFFDYFPIFNKFRSPNSILSITALLIPLLAVLGVGYLKSMDKKLLFKPLYISFGILGGISFILAIVGPSLFDFSAPGDDQLSQANILVETIATRKALLTSDSFRSFFLMLLAAGSIWLYLKNKIKLNVVILIIGLLAFGDLFVVNKRYINSEDFVNKSRASAVFNPRDVDNQILQDQDPHYRVLDLSINTFNSSMSSYYHKTIGGYHAAKLQRYQDLIDRHITKGNMSVLNMLNAKYVIQGQPGQESVQVNDRALGNAWFVDSLVVVKNANEEIDSLSNFNPGNKAYIHEEFESYLEGFDPVKSGNISLTKYTPDILTYESNAGSDQFAVFSEIWYGPDKGWKAFIDGKETDFIRVNYALRGLKVPSGKHEIIFEFKPTSYYLGENISLMSSGLLLLLLILVLATEFRRFMKP
ncbi:MAG TPA: hypothetical protein DCX89_08720, partial [Saprospirales bacterium]|nr:hypothetical protein [Saprospirales bacterium]HRQ30825.1 YfhO family protein [Saprospiraceae bacterium]